MKTNKHFVLVFAGIMIATLSLTAQAPPDHKSKMEKLSAMSGKWTGGGWMTTPDRQTVQFTQKENIQYELNGSVLRVRGEGFGKDGKQIHNALGIIFYDLTTSKYYMDSFLETGQQVKAEIELTDSGMNWSFQTELGATVKYIITIKDGKWNEKGFYSPDGVAEYPFIEFNLVKD